MEDSDLNITGIILNTPTFSRGLSFISSYLFPHLFLSLFVPLFLWSVCCLSVGCSGGEAGESAAEPGYRPGSCLPETGPGGFPKPGGSGAGGPGLQAGSEGGPTFLRGHGMCGFLRPRSQRHTEHEQRQHCGMLLTWLDSHAHTYSLSNKQRHRHKSNQIKVYWSRTQFSRCLAKCFCY